MGIANFIDKVKHYFSFSKKEISSFVLTVAAFAFIFSFTRWGEAAPSLSEGIKNFLLALIIAGISFFVHHAAQKLIALHYGIKAEHRFLWKALLGCLIVIFLSNGRLMLFVASSLTLSLLPYHHLGRERKGPDILSYAIIALSGPLANVLFATAAITLSSSAFAKDIFTFNILFSAYNLLPIPPLDGSHVFYGSRMLYAFVFGFILAYVLLSYLVGIYALFFAVVSGGIFWFVFYFFFEREWTSPHP